MEMMWNKFVKYMIKVTELSHEELGNKFPRDTILKVSAESLTFSPSMAFKIPEKQKRELKTEPPSAIT